MPISQTWTFFDGGWHEGNPSILGPRSHAFWLASSVFDGARVFEGVMPDLERHLARLNASALALGLLPQHDVETMAGLTREGARKFSGAVPLYVKPMLWAEADSPASVIIGDPASTRFCLCLFEAPMPEPKGGSLTLSPFRRPTIETMPTDAKAGCLYPNNARALREAKARGFDNCLVRDMLGNIAETATANVFLVKDGVVKTPAPNGAFLNGITRQRVIGLLRADGMAVEEGRLTFEDFLAADEIFQSGNYSKISPVTRIETRDLPIGPVARRARALYWDFAHSNAAAAA